MKANQMNILVLNCGSSSVKYQLIEIGKEKVLARGLVERIGLEGSKLKHEAKKRKIIIEDHLPDHDTAIDIIIKVLLNDDFGVIKDINDIKAVGHRVVHGGEFFIKSSLITDDFMKTLKECIPLAPLHNPANIMGINAIKKILPEIPQVGVFDTSFHQTIPEKAYIYPIPYEFYEKNRIRKYGFHGTSHRYVSHRAAEFLKLKYENLKIITAHLGNGASIAAIDRGKSIDTSMGYTPLEGLVMGTRSGDIDPAIPMILARDFRMNPASVDSLLNKKSGVLGISGISSDMRDLEEKALKNNKRAKLALDIYSYRLKKYIGSYIAAMGGVDIIVFTAGIGENSDYIREKTLEGLEFFGVKLDKKKNKGLRGKEADISSPDSKVKILIIPTNEELVIARDTKDIIINLKNK
jgi:acetate kinase